MSFDNENDRQLNWIGQLSLYREKTECMLKGFELGLYPVYKKYGFTFQQAFQAYQAEQAAQGIWRTVNDDNNNNLEDWEKQDV